MYFIQNWRRVRTKVRNLLRLGVSKSLAVTCGSSGKAAMEGGHATSAGAASSKSYWRNSKTEGLQDVGHTLNAGAILSEVFTLHSTMSFSQRRD